MIGLDAMYFSSMIPRNDLKDGEAKIEAFLTDLAVGLDVSTSTQILDNRLSPKK